MRYAVTGLILFCFIGFVTFSFADSGTSKHYEWSDKLSRGAINIVTSPVEIPRQINNTSRQQGPALGWTLGFLKGIGGTILRIGTGLVDVLTSPFDFPVPGKAPIIEPEFGWEDWEGA